MKGKWIYFTVASLMGMLASFINVFICMTLLFLLIFLYKKKNFSKRQLLAVSVFFTIFFLRSEMIERENFSRLVQGETNFIVYLQENLKVDGDTFTGTAKELK
ncbi:hypothetical protein V7164_22750, partial [Bacillus sp. JJ1474]